MEKRTAFRIKAAAIHFIFSLLIALTAIALIFYIWYPGIFSEALGGFKLFFLVVGCDVVIGPCLTFVIFNITKPKRELFIDCSLVVLLQLGALSYGMWIVAEARPVYVVFVRDRLEIVSAVEFEPEDLKDLPPATEKYGHFSLGGPSYVAIKFPEEGKERSEMLLKTVTTGRDYQLFPRFYQPYNNAISEIVAALKPINKLKFNSEQQKELQEAIQSSKLPEDQLGWLLAKSRFGFYTALINRTTGYPISYLLIDPEAE